MERAVEHRRGRDVHRCLLRLAGGVNVFADLRGWPQVSAEAVITRNPDVIFLTYPHRLPMKRLGWERVAAIRTGRVHVVDASVASRPGPRIVEFLAALARLLHPDLFGRAQPAEYWASKLATANMPAVFA